MPLRDLTTTGPRCVVSTGGIDLIIIAQALDILDELF